jgi:hypothetical protein
MAAFLARAGHPARGLPRANRSEEPLRPQ